MKIPKDTLLRSEQEIVVTNIGCLIIVSVDFGEKKKPKSLEMARAVQHFKAILQQRSDVTPVV